MSKSGYDPPQWEIQIVAVTPVASTSEYLALHFYALFFACNFIALCILHDNLLITARSTIICVQIFVYNTVGPLYNAVLGGTRFLGQKPRYREVRVIERFLKIGPQVLKLVKSESKVAKFSCLCSPVPQIHSILWLLHA